MANKTINAFDELANIATDDYILVWDTSASATLKISADNLVASGLIPATKIPDLDMAKITTGNLNANRIDATGVASSSTYLRGDYTWSNLPTFTNYSIPTDGLYNGNIITLTAGENLAFGDLCYFKNDGKVYKTNATAVATSKGLVLICTETILADASGDFLFNGMITNSAWAFTAGDVLYLSTTAGVLTSTKPSATTNVVRIAGYAVSATAVVFNPDGNYIEIV